MELSNKIVLVTGGTSGIGLEAAKLFREEGATVIIIGQCPARLQSAASELGDSVALLRGDVSKPADIESIVQQILRKFGLLANAGMGLAAPLEAITENQIDTQFDVNFKGVFFTIRKVAPLLDKGGSIVVTTSFLNEVGAPGFSILSATKAAVRWSLMAAYRGFDFLGAKRRRLRKLAAAFPFQPSAALSVLSQNRRFDRAPMISAYPRKAAV